MRSTLLLGATFYGGPAMIGVMPADLQEKRTRLTTERFVEGLSLVSLRPGAAATMAGLVRTRWRSLAFVRGGSLS